MDRPTPKRLIPDQRCAFCDTDLSLYQLGTAWICTDHLAASVSMAANDVWPEMVRYSHEFEAVLL